jgi:hypothetical protein
MNTHRLRRMLGDARRRLLDGPEPPDPWGDGEGVTVPGVGYALAWYHYGGVRLLIGDERRGGSAEVRLSAAEARAFAAVVAAAADDASAAAALVPRTLEDYRPIAAAIAATLPDASESGPDLEDRIACALFELDAYPEDPNALYRVTWDMPDMARVADRITRTHTDRSARHGR